MDQEDQPETKVLQVNEEMRAEPEKTEHPETEDLQATREMMALKENEETLDQKVHG